MCTIFSWINTLCTNNINLIKLMNLVFAFHIFLTKTKSRICYYVGFQIYDSWHHWQVLTRVIINRFWLKNKLLWVTNCFFFIYTHTIPISTFKMAWVKRNSWLIKQIIKWVTGVQNLILKPRKIWRLQL